MVYFQSEFFSFRLVYQKYLKFLIYLKKRKKIKKYLIKKIKDKLIQFDLNFLSSIKPTNDIENIFIIESQLFRKFPYGKNGKKFKKIKN